MKIGVDVGGTNLVAGLVDKQGRIVIREEMPTCPEEGYDKVLSRIIALIRMVKKQGAEKNLASDSVAIGLGIPGIVSRDARTAVDCPNLFWKNESLADDLEREFGGSVHIANDATVAAIAENYFGSTKGYKDSVMITLGTGVGGGIILNGQIIIGHHGVASEIGHMLVGSGLYQCNCGKWGCLETYSSATALIKNTKTEINKGRETSIVDRVGGDLAKITAKTVIDAAKLGDQLALGIFRLMTEHLGLALSNMTDIIDPAIYVFGGGVAKAGDFLIDAITEEYNKRRTYPALAQPKICTAVLENDAGVIGAAYISEYLQ